MLRPMDPTQPECAKCGIFFQTQDKVPVGGELAWALYFELNSEIVQRFGLIDQVWECYGLELSVLEFSLLVDLLEDIESGIASYHKDKPKEKDNGT